MIVAAQVDRLGNNSEILMKSRFEGPDGQRRLIATLQSCFLVEHNEELATAVC